MKTLGAHWITSLPLPSIYDSSIIQPCPIHYADHTNPTKYPLWLSIMCEFMFSLKLRKSKNIFRLNLISSFFWDVTHRILVIKYKRFGTPYLSHHKGSTLGNGNLRLSQNVGDYRLRCVTAQKSEYLIYTAAEVWNRTYIHTYMHAHINTYIHKYTHIKRHGHTHINSSA